MNDEKIKVNISYFYLNQDMQFFFGKSGVLEAQNNKIQELEENISARDKEIKAVMINSIKKFCYSLN